MSFGSTSFRQSGSSSPNFLQQRQIAYVDNPFDEQASMSMQKCDIKCLNFPRTEQTVQKDEVPKNSSPIVDILTEKKKKASKEVCGFGFQREICDSSDWSCLFSPVQCHINSPTGELQLSLSYDPLLSTLKVAIIKARGLTCPICASKSRNSGIICVGTFISITLLCNNRQVQSKKTEMKTRKAEIFFYDKFSFLVQNNDASHCSLQCRAVHKVGSIIKRDHVIGQVLIGGEGRCDGDGLRHWQEMLRRPKKSITQWHYLQES